MASQSLTVFRLPQRANVDRCIAALKALDPAIVQHLEATQLASARAALVFAYWAKVMHKLRPLLDPKREKRLLSRLAENAGDVSELLYAVDGASQDEWTMGRDARSPRAYNGIETIFRDREQVERFAETQTGYQHEQAHPLAVKYSL